MRGVLAAALVVGCAAGCGGVSPEGMPGTATCEIGRAEKTVGCRDICSAVANARSSAEAEDLRSCALEQCDTDCE